MEILKKTENSILWLLNNNSKACENLIKEAEKRNIDSSRVIFADKLVYAEHLSRFEIMDLFLDTFPYNGHTTVIEAIRRKVPTLTVMGQSYASRVAGSLMCSIGLDELATNNLEDYKNIAIEIANNNRKFKEIKRKVSLKKTQKLFDAKNYTKNLEQLYLNIIKNYN